MPHQSVSSNILHTIWQQEGYLVFRTTASKSPNVTNTITWVLCVLTVIGRNKDNKSVNDKDNKSVNDKTISQ